MICEIVVVWFLLYWNTENDKSVRSWDIRVTIVGLFWYPCANYDVMQSVMIEWAIVVAHNSMSLHISHCELYLTLVLWVRNKTWTGNGCTKMSLLVNAFVFFSLKEGGRERGTLSMWSLNSQPCPPQQMLLRLEFVTFVTFESHEASLTEHLYTPLSNIMEIKRGNWQHTWKLCSKLRKRLKLISSIFQNRQLHVQVIFDFCD